jgi:hypothetical protein
VTVSVLLMQNRMGNSILFYELVQAGVIPKSAPGARRADQNTIEALTHLREAGLVPWDWIIDETRELTQWRTASSVAEYVADAARHASIDRWDGLPAPLIICESRSLAGALRDTASSYACPIASTNGQVRGFLVTKVAPSLRHRQRVLYLGEFGREFDLYLQISVDLLCQRSVAPQLFSPRCRAGKLLGLNRIRRCLG